MRDMRIFRIFEGTNDILRLFIALTGMQHAGAHLKELHNKALFQCHGLAKIQLLLLEFWWTRHPRGLKVGFSFSNKNLSTKVNPNFADAAAVLSQDVSMFGTSVETVLIKHGKEVMNQQFLLNRIANAAIDIYVATCVISRCSSSLEQGLESAQNEQMMTKVWCSEAHTRIVNNLDMLKDPS